MKVERQPYSFVVLRYVHDVICGEFANVGLVMLSPKESLLMGETKKTTQHIKHMFPTLDETAFVDAMESIDRSIGYVRNDIDRNRISDNSDVLSYAYKILPKDDSSLQWSGVGYGVCEDSKVAFDRIYRRHVSKYEVLEQD